MEEVPKQSSQNDGTLQESEIQSQKSFNKSQSNADMSDPLFCESPVYEQEDDGSNYDVNTQNMLSADGDKATEAEPSVDNLGVNIIAAKRKLSDEQIESKVKMQKLESIQDELSIPSQALDDEVSEITSASKQGLIDLVLPSTSRIRTPVRSSPRKNKRSNSTEVINPRTPKTPKSRAASADITRQRRTPSKEMKKIEEYIPEEVIVISESPSSRPSIEFVQEIPPLQPTLESVIEEKSNEANDSQSFHLALSPSPEEDDEEKLLNDVSDDTPKDKNYNSDPVKVKDRNEILYAGTVHETKSEGYYPSEENKRNSQPPYPKDFYKGKTTDQESTDSVGSISLESPDLKPMVTSKLISKLSNGNSSTPTEDAIKRPNSISDSDNTPDMAMLNGNKGLRTKTESFRPSNTTTPSTISPLQNGHSLPANTPRIPCFDVHVSHNEDGEFLSLYIVRTDNDLGADMCKEYQRFSKRFTIDPYLGDVSLNTSPSSVSSMGMINLPNRTSFASTVSSTSTSSNRTNDGNFVVPQPPRKSISHPASSIKGYDALMKKLQDIFSHIRDASINDGNASSSEDKISIGIQASLSDGASLSNGIASPVEVSKCDKTTPKSSLKKTRVRGRRPLTGKTKRAILPTQAEEPEYMHGMNSPEMVPTNSENGQTSPKTIKEEKPFSTLIATPKSVGKLKQKIKRPTSPRPATPVERPLIKQEYPGFPADTVVLAKWVDKRYYSGKVLEITEPNKYLIKFDDGQTKALLDDFIIFGNMRTLPLEGQSVYAMVDEDQNYEPGLVLGLEESASGTVTYRCTTDGDTTVSVTASELYLTEDQARSIKETVPPRSPCSGPNTPRRRGLRELDLDNIIQGPRSARTRDKGSSSGRKRVASPKSPKASTSGLKSKSTPICRRRVASESSELSESSNSAPPIRIEEVAGVEPEVQKTPRKIDGVKAGPLQLKGAAKQNIGKKNSKLTKFCLDEHTISELGPIPPSDAKFFAGCHFLLTCTEQPKISQSAVDKETRHYSSEEDGESTSTMAGTDTEELQFCDKPFNKERLKEQCEAAGGIVHSHFDDVPASAYASCRLIAPRPCLTAKYICCVASGVRAVCHSWVIACCDKSKLLDADAFALPAGWSITERRFINWIPSTGKRNIHFFKDKVILLCGDQDTFVKFWERVCTLAGALTRVVNEDDINTSSAIALVTEWDCPHEVQNKANQDNVPLVSTTWVVQCLISGKVLPPTSHVKYSFMYTEPE